MKIHAIIFDMDGLMFDTERIMADGWMLAGRAAGPTIGEEFLKDNRGTGAAQAKIAFEKQYGSGYNFDLIRQGRIEYTKSHIEKHGVPVKKGLKELLSYLKENKYKIILATSTPKDVALSYLESTGVKPYFDDFVCGDMVQKHKPDPEIFCEAAKRAGYLPGQCVVLEDSFNGIKAARAGGFIPVMVPDMTQPDGELELMLAAKCDTLLDVIVFLEGRQKRGD